MARKTISSLETRIAELEAANAALEARLVVAREVYRNQKSRIADLESQLAARGAAKVIAVQPKAQPVQPVITRFVRRDGTVCERVRTGNRAVIRELPRAEMTGIEVVYQ